MSAAAAALHPRSFGHTGPDGHVVTTSSVPPLRAWPIGELTHRRAVQTLRESYAAIPPGATVRLAKRTSNLFRPRASTQALGLDVSGLGGVISIDTDAATTDVQGMCTYERLVATTLPYGLMPKVVPQLRTITLGGAVTGLGIEASSFRNGLPHESVLELDILTGDGQLVTAAPHNEHAGLFAAFPNSYGSLGYATRIRIELEPVHPYVSLRNLAFTDATQLAETVADICARGSFEGEPVHFLDGVAFSPTELYLMLGRWSDSPGRLSDYTGQLIYYRSIPTRAHDYLTVHDYLWRWDTDWFWCSQAFGAQNPRVRPWWPGRYRRSDIYHRMVGLENHFGLAARLDARRGLPPRERVVQDVEIPVERLAEFLSWFDEHVGMRPVWLCPVQLREASGWPLYPLEPGRAYVNVGFWGTVAIQRGDENGDVNRRIETAVTTFDGHKSLYSDAYFTPEEFARRYGGPAYQRVRARYDSAGRLTDLYDKVVGRA